MIDSLLMERSPFLCKMALQGWKNGEEQTCVFALYTSSAVEYQTLYVLSANKERAYGNKPLASRRANAFKEFNAWWAIIWTLKILLTNTWILTTSARAFVFAVTTLSLTQGLSAYLHDIPFIFLANVPCTLFSMNPSSRKGQWRKSLSWQNSI